MRQWFAKWISFDQMQLNTRSTWIAFVFACILLIASLEWFLIFPKQTEIEQLTTHAQSQEQLRLQLEQQQKPQAVRDAEILSVLEQTPVDDSWETFFAEMQELFQQTAVTVQKFDLQMDTTQMDVLLNVTQSPNGNDMISQPFYVEVQGNYAQLTQFIERINGLKRIVHVKSWEIRTSNAQPIADEDALMNSEQPMVLNVNAAIYQSPAYAQAFQSVLPKKSISSEQRSNPTLTDQQFFDQLMQQNQAGSIQP